MILLTDLKTINKTRDITVQYGTEVVGLPGDMVRSFIRCTNAACKRFPNEDVLAEGLRLIPPEFREVLEWLYEKLNDVIV